MIFRGTYVTVVDNSGAKLAQCIGFHKKIKYGSVGSIISVTLIRVFPNKKIQRKEVYRALVVSTVKNKFIRGAFLTTFPFNSVVLLKNNELQLLATRVIKPISREIRWFNNARLLSLAPRVFLYLFVKKKKFFYSNYFL